MKKRYILLVVLLPGTPLILLILWYLRNRKLKNEGNMRAMEPGNESDSVGT